MRKVLLTILAFVYLGTSTGIAMDIHYCMGKVIGVEVFTKAKNACPKCDTNEQGCCGKQHKFYKLSKTHTGITNDLSIVHSGIVTSLPSYHTYNGIGIITLAHQAICNNSPPGYTGRSACILYCTFRI